MKRAALFVLFASFAVSGCQSVLVKEVRYTGGYPGYLLDKRMIDSSEVKSAQLLRAAMIVAMASRMATVSVREGADADAFVDYLAAATDEINYAASNLYDVETEATKTSGAATSVPCNVGPQGTEDCNAYAVNFEADIPLLEARIVRLMLASLPEDRAREFLEDLASGTYCRLHGVRCRQ